MGVGGGVEALGGRQMCLVGHTVDIVKETWAGAFACTDHLNFFWWTPRASMAFEYCSD